MVLGERAKKALQIQPNICKPMNSAPERQHDFSRPAARQLMSKSVLIAF
jgi:hypothetical protein